MSKIQVLAKVSLLSPKPSAFLSKLGLRPSLLRNPEAMSGSYSFL